MKKTTIVALLSLLGLLAGAASAQTVPTGSVDATIGGESHALATYAMHVDADVAADIEDEEARDFASRFAGTDQHSATYLATDAVTVGDSVIAPATVTVMIAARADPDPRADDAKLRLNFSLDPATLTLLPDMAIELRYEPDGGGLSDAYVLLEDTGEVRLDRVEATGETSLSVEGAFRGTLGFRADAMGDPDPSDTLPIEGTFAIDAVVGSTALVDLLEGE